MVAHRAASIHLLIGVVDVVEPPNGPRCCNLCCP